MSLKVRYLYVVLIVATLVMTGAGVSFTFSLMSEARYAQESFRDNLTGMAAQADYEIATLIDTLERFAQPDAPVAHQEVIDRFDVLWSRLETNSSGETGRFYLALDGARATMAELGGLLARLEPDVMALQKGDGAAVVAISNELRPFVERIHAVTLASVLSNAERAAYLHSIQTRAGFWASVFLVGVLAMGFTVAGMLWLERRRLNDANLTLERRVEERAGEIRDMNRRLRREVADRTRIEEDLRASEGRFSAIIENAPTAIMLKDLEGRFSLVNRKFREWYGSLGEDAIGRTSSEIYPRQYAERFIDMDRVVIGTRKVVEQECDIPFADGSIRTVQCTKFPVTLPDGELAGVGTFNMDITERKQAEAQLQENERLLRHAQKMEAVGQLTGGVAHDFNNLLAAIQGNAEILSEEMPDPNESVREILHAAGRGAELTRRLLAFSRQQPLQPVAVDVRTLVDQLHGMLRRTLGETVSIRVASAPSLWQTRADPGQLENALLNLSINARDAMPEGGTLTIDCRNAHIDARFVAMNPEAAVGEYVVISVIDEGTGMSPETLQRAFEPFYTTKGIGRGTGLGLSMVYGFVKQSGGFVGLSSQVGRGTAVKLYLPREIAAGQAAEAERKRELPLGTGEQVLVVEDDENVRRLAVRMLERLGYAVHDVGDAQEALDLLDRGEEVRLILSDVVLPGGISGPELAQQVRARHPHVAFVLMSGYLPDTERTSVLSGGEASYLMKPFQRADLAEAMRRAIVA